MPSKAFNAAWVENEPAPASGRVEWFDSSIRGLCLRITAAGGKTWSVVYRPKAGPHKGKVRRHTLGRYVRPDLAEGVEGYGLAAARRDAQVVLAEVEQGADPAADKQAAKNIPENIPEPDPMPSTFEDLVADYHKRWQVGKRANATADEAKRTILKGCPDWHARAIDSFTAAEVARHLEAIRDGGAEQRGRPYLANRLYAYLRTFFSWCAKPEVAYLLRSPMEGLERPWDGEQPRDRVYGDDELRALWGAADRIGGHAGAFLKIAILTGKRKGALAAMKWPEIEGEFWHPAGGGKKNKRVHATPLVPLARRVITSLDREAENDHVFLGRRSGGHLDPGTWLQDEVKAQSKTDDSPGVPDFAFHAIRHTLETSLAALGVQPHIRDLLFDHAPQRGAGKGYDHHAYRAELMKAAKLWADHVAGLVTPKGTALLK